MKNYQYKTINGLKRALENAPGMELTYTKNYTLISKDVKKFLDFFNINLKSIHPHFYRRLKGYFGVSEYRVTPEVGAILENNKQMIDDIVKYI